MCTGAFKTYQSVTGATVDSATGLLKIDATQYDNLQSLVFTIGGVRGIRSQPRIDADVLLHLQVPFEFTKYEYSCPRRAVAEEANL